MSWVEVRGMALCPFATHRLIEPGVNDPPIRPRVAILHVAVSKAASLFPFFRHRSGGIEAHFYITLTGKIEQYRDTDFEADANYLANPFAISIETAGFGGGRWNKPQMRAIKRLLRWLSETHPIPLQRCPSWNGAGVGYHIQFGAPGKWTNVAKSCPGPKRIEQFADELEPWFISTTEEDDMGMVEKMRHRITNRKRNKDVGDALRAALDNEESLVRVEALLIDVRSGVSEILTRLDNIDPDKNC